MIDDDFDRDEIDRLVKELAAPPKPVAPPQSAAQQEAAPAPLKAGSRWSSVRILMPAERTQRRDWLAFASAIRLPTLPALSALPWLRVLPKLPKLPPLPAFSVPALSGIDLGALFVRLFVGLGVLLSAAMPYWPYAHAWSWGLLFYFCTVMLLLVAGIWGAKLTWDARLPAAHTLAIGTVVWGLGLLATEAVPRIVYV